MQGITSGALLIALAVGQRGDDLDCPLDEPLDLGQGLLNEPFECGKGPRRLHPVIAYPLETFGKRMLHHAPNKGGNLHRFLLDPLAFMRTIVIGDTLPIIAVNPSQ